MQHCRTALPLLFACAALLIASNCLPPIAFHDGLPARTLPPNKAEGSIGYHHMFWSEGYPLAYYSHGVRVGFGEPPLATEVGLRSVVLMQEGNTSAMLGPVFGFGYQGPNLSIIGRPSFYMLGVGREGVSIGLWPQMTLLVGNGYPDSRFHLSAGGRISFLAVGPVLVVGTGLGPVDLRLEGSYMLPASGISCGQALTVGLTVGAPAVKIPDNRNRADNNRR